MATIGSLNTILTADSSKFDRGFRSARRSVDGFNSAITGNLNTSLTRFGAAFAGAFSVRAIGRSFKATMDMVDSQTKFADLVGISTERLAGLGLAARMSGVETSTLNTALQRMVRRVAQAAQGTGEARVALERLGLEAKALATRSPDEQFYAIADAMKQIGDRGTQVATAMQIFDTEGVPLLRVLDEGSRGLRQWQKEAESAGLAFDRSFGKRIERAKDKLALMSEQWDGFKLRFLSESGGLSALESFVGNANAGLSSVTGKGNGGLASFFTNLFSETVKAGGGNNSDGRPGGAFIRGALNGYGSMIRQALDIAPAKGQFDLPPLPTMNSFAARRDEREFLRKISEDISKMVNTGVPGRVSHSR